jgi:hypothetical protein
MVALPTQLSDKVFSVMENLIKDGLVELGERGSSRPGDPDHQEAEGDVVKKFTEAIATYRKDRGGEDKCTYADATSAVAAMDPQLYSEYRDAVSNVGA